MKDYAELEKRLREQMAARVRDVWSKNERERYERAGSFGQIARFGWAEEYVDAALATAKHAGYALINVSDLLEVIKPFADCAEHLEGSEDVERTPDEEWAKFRLVAYEYRRLAAFRHALLSRAESEKSTDGK